jgi:transcriptional regulator with XRE-family HTH domain
VGKPIAQDLGFVLRRVRLARGLTLREVGRRSHGVFTPTAVAGYERGERMISLQRFCDLCTFYGVQPDEVLASVLRPEGGGGVIDLAALEEREPHDA